MHGGPGIVEPQCVWEASTTEVKKERQENEMYSKTAGGQIYQSPLANTDKKGEKIILISWVNAICWMWGEPGSLPHTLKLV